MKAIFYLFIIIPAMSQSQNTNKESGKNTDQIIHAESIEELPRRLTHIKPRAKTLKDWLFNFCDLKKPNKPIEEFKLDLSISSSDGYRLRLYGVNKYANTTFGYDTRIDFMPKSSDMYYVPAKIEYENLDYHQFKVKITKQIKEILSIEKFKTSFLAEADHIYLSFTGEKIILK